MPWTKKYRHHPEQYLQDEARYLIQGKPLSLLPWCETPEGPEFLKPAWDDLVASLAALGSDNWKPDAHLARLWHARGAAEKKKCRDEVLAYMEAVRDCWMGDERGAIYFPHHAALPVGAAKWARKEQDRELLSACADVILWAVAFRRAVTYEGVCYWIGQRSAGVDFERQSQPGVRSFGRDFDLFALGKIRPTPEGQRGRHWTGFDHILHDCWQEVYGAAKPLRDGEQPLAVMERLGFRLLEPVYILQTTDGFATWECQMRSSDTQAVLGVVKLSGDRHSARYLPSDYLNDRKDRAKGKSSLKLIDNALLYRSPVYGEQEEPLPPGDPILYVIVGGREGGIEDLLAGSEDEPPVDPPDPEDPPTPEDPPVDPEPEKSWWQRLVEAWKEYWSGR